MCYKQRDPCRDAEDRGAEAQDTLYCRRDDGEDNGKEGKHGSE